MERMILAWLLKIIKLKINYFRRCFALVRMCFDVIGIMYGLVLWVQSNFARTDSLKRSFRERKAIRIQDRT